MGKELLIRIQSDPARCGGRPCIRDTRMRVTDVLELFAAGASRAEILADFPYLEDADLSAALAYAALFETRFQEVKTAFANGERRVEVTG